MQTWDEPEVLQVEPICVSSGHEPNLRLAGYGTARDGSDGDQLDGASSAAWPGVMRPLS